MQAGLAGGLAGAFGGPMRTFGTIGVIAGNRVIFEQIGTKSEQKQRLEARLADPTKQWKFAVGDLAHRERWDDYMAAFEDALNETSTTDAPWFVIPANHKWYRNWAILKLLVDQLEALNLEYPPAPADLAGVTIPD